MISAWKEVYKLPRENWILFFTTLANRVGTMVLPFLMLYLTKHLEYTPLKAAAIFTVFGLVATLSVPLSGWLIDKVGTPFVIKASLLGSAATLMCIPFAMSYIQVLILVAAFAVFAEAFRPASMTFLSEINTKEDYKLSYALNRFAINLGMSIGPLVGGFLVEYHYHLLFRVDALTSVLAFVVYTIGVKKFFKQSGAVKSLTPSIPVSWRALFLQQRVFFLFVLAILPFGMIFMQGESTLPLYITGQLHLPEKYYGMIFSINTGLILVFEIWLNVKMRHWTDASQIYLGCLLVGLGMGLSFFAPAFFWLVIPTMLWTFGEMILFPATTSAVLGFSNEKNRGLIMGFYTMTFSCSQAFGPTLGTRVYEMTGYPGLGYFCILACLLSILLIKGIFSLQRRGLGNLQSQSGSIE